MLHRIKRFLLDEDGPTAVEYSIMLALIVMVCVSSIIFIGTTTDTMFGSVSEGAFNENNNGGLGP